MASEWQKIGQTSQSTTPTSLCDFEGLEQITPFESVHTNCQAIKGLIFTVEKMSC